MELSRISDDFFKIGNIAILQRMTGDGSYDFDFRNHFECHSVLGKINEPVLLHIGAIADYAGIEEEFGKQGIRLSEDFTEYEQSNN